jgi:hypothetical protein
VSGWGAEVSLEGHIDTARSRPGGGCWDAPRPGDPGFFCGRCGAGRGAAHGTRRARALRAVGARRSGRRTECGGDQEEKEVDEEVDDGMGLGEAEDTDLDTLHEGWRIGRRRRRRRRVGGRRRRRVCDSKQLQRGRGAERSGKGV